MSQTSLAINEGSQTLLLTDSLGGTEVGVVKIDISPAGFSGTLFNGTVGVSSLPSIPGGTLNSVTIAGGTVSVNELSGTINVGTAILSGGTIAAVQNAGTIQGGTLNLTQTVSTVGSVSGMGTLTNVGSITNIGTIGTIVGMAPGTYVNLTTGTLNAGTINVATVTAGSIVVTTGTVVGNGGSMQMQGLAGSAVAVSGNPVYMAGQGGNGTIYPLLTDTKGQLQIGGGTISMINSATISSLPNLPQGSINVTAGTITAGTINAATITSGSIVVTTGTIGAGTLNAATVTGGSIVVTTGTQNAGTVNTGTINTGTINAATINGGTIQLNPLTATNTISNVGTSGTTAIGTLLGTSSIGAGTAVYITGYEILVISGTCEVILAFGSQTNGAQVVSHGNFPVGGGVTKAKIYPHGYGTTNSPLTYQILSGSGTVSWSVDYFLHT